MAVRDPSPSSAGEPLHNAERAALEFAEKLASRDRHVVFFLGAGASCAAGLPDLASLQVAVRDKLAAPDREVFVRLSSSRNIEGVLSRLRLIAQVLEGTTDSLDGLVATAASDLDRRICASIATVMASQSVNLDAHVCFARWLGSGRYNRPIETFTTNYDLLLERGLEQASVPYFDGFIGVHEGRFRADLVDGGEVPDLLLLPAGWVRVWKLHGSVSWMVKQAKGGTTITRNAASKDVKPEDVLAIYPSTQKYQESRRIPFVVLADRLRRALAVPKTVCIVCGYSFGDDHINEVLFDGARLHPSSEVIVLCFKDIPEQVRAQAATVPNLTVYSPERAIVGGLEGPWQAVSTESPFWEAGFSLGDFGAFARFMMRNTRQTTAAPVSPPE